MAYFSNGTEGMDYEYEYCANCVHNDTDPLDTMSFNNCSVLALHMEFNYDQLKKGKTAKAIKQFLDALIPTPHGEIWPGECSMFVDKARVAGAQDEANYLKELQNGKAPVFGVPVK